MTVRDQGQDEPGHGVGMSALPAFVWVRWEGKGSDRGHAVIAPLLRHLLRQAVSRDAGIADTYPVIPAKAGIQSVSAFMDSGISYPTNQWTP